MKAAPKLYRTLLEVSELDKAADFYSKLLDAPNKRVSPGRHYFYCGETILALFDPKREDGWDPRPSPGCQYFSVPNLEEVHVRARELKCLSKKDVHGAPGGQITTKPWGERSFYAEDRFENALCFVDEKTVFTGKDPHAAR